MTYDDYVATGVNYKMTIYCFLLSTYQANYTGQRPSSEVNSHSTSQKILPLMVPEVSTSGSQEPTTGYYFEPDDFTRNLFL
jgi:hypothetical protein